ncbi:hypothetical protein HO151_02580, partial [Streptomyces sp. 8P21H-1]|nr:hypothetical protein [Streptomyces sp. 8P21H-1]
TTGAARRTLVTTVAALVVAAVVTTLTRLLAHRLGVGGLRRRLLRHGRRGGLDD